MKWVTLITKVTSDLVLSELGDRFMSEANSRATVKRYGTLKTRVVEIVGADDRWNTDCSISYPYE